MVDWGVLRTEHCATNDTANTTETNKGGRAEGTLPLPSDVVRLPSENARNVGVGGSGGEEDSKVASTDVFHVSEESDTWASLASC